MEVDVKNARHMLAESEKARRELQTSLEEAARRASEEAEKNKKYQDIIIHENQEQ